MSISVSGSITGAAITGDSIAATTHTGTTLSVTGNITGGNVNGGANVNATTHTGTTVSVSGNITGGNITTGGVGTFTGSYMVVPTNATSGIESSVTTVGAFYYNTTNAVFRIRGTVLWTNA